MYFELVYKIYCGYTGIWTLALESSSPTRDHVSYRSACTVQSQCTDFYHNSQAVNCVPIIATRKIPMATILIIINIRTFQSWLVLPGSEFRSSRLTHIASSERTFLNTGLLHCIFVPSMSYRKQEGGKMNLHFYLNRPFSVPFPPF